MSEMAIGGYEYWQSSENGLWYFRLKAANHRTITPSQGYKTERGCLNGIASVRWNAQGPIKRIVQN